jgi:hypothetical protein
VKIVTAQQMATLTTPNNIKGLSFITLCFTFELLAEKYFPVKEFPQWKFTYNLSEKDKPLLTQRRYGAKTQGLFYKTSLLCRVFSFLLPIFLICPQSDQRFSEMP